MVTLTIMLTRFKKIIVYVVPVIAFALILGGFVIVFGFLLG